MAILTRFPLTFTPKFIPTLVTMILFPCLLGLGFWQLDRAQQKKQLITAYEHRKSTPLSLTEVKEKWADFRYYPMQVTGRYDNQHSLLLDNRTYQGDVGYHVMTPLQIAGSDKVLLVNRGFISAQGDRQHLPVIVPVSGELQLTGLISPIPRTFVLGHPDEPANVWPSRIQEVDLNKISEQLGKSIYPFILLLAPKQPTGFVRDWHPVTMPPSRHIGYAVQWFALAVTLLVIFISVNTHRRGPTPHDKRTRER